MKKRIVPSGVSGVIEAPASKSYAQRAVAAALLAPGTSTLDGLTLCDDTEAAIRVAGALGAATELKGRTLRVDGGLNPRTACLHCGEAGLCIRMFTPIAALSGARLTLTGHGGLLTRPVDFIEAPLTQLGVRVTTHAGCPPITVQGPLQGGNADVDGSVSSQFITGLLMAAPSAARDTVLRVTNPKSTPYLDMTMDVLGDFGIRVDHRDYRAFRIPGGQRYRPADYAVEGDWSGAAFLLVAGAVSGPVTVANLNPDSRQADRAIVDALRACGATLAAEAGGLTVSAGRLRGFTFDATHCPDLFPPLTALAAACDGVTEIAGVSRLTHKESNRGAALRHEFGKMGVRVDVDGDRMIVCGAVPRGAVIDSHGDHRMAMAAAVAALRASGPVLIDNPDCVAKSYPGFFDAVARLGARVERCT
jgi:3-phosphoshikimate 1-carboxyvinyltransferase